MLVSLPLPRIGPHFLINIATGVSDSIALFSLLSFYKESDITCSVVSHRRRAEQQKKGNKPATVAKGNGAAAVVSTKTAVQGQVGIGSVSDIRTSHGTHHIRKFFGGAEVPAPTKAALDITAADHAQSVDAAGQDLLIDSDGHPVLRGVALDVP